jgi:hypothetical protein
MLNFLLFKKVGLLYGRVGAGAASKFLPGLEPHKNDAAPQHWAPVQGKDFYVAPASGQTLFKESQNFYNKLN